MPEEVTAVYEPDQLPEDNSPSISDVATAAVSDHNTTWTTTETKTSTGWDPVFLTYFIINSIFILLIITGNTTTIVLLIRYRSLRTVTNMFAMSLACADIIMGFSYGVYNIINYTPLSEALVPLHYPCAISLYFILLSAGSSLLSLMCIAIDRYIAVIHPLNYQIWMHRGRARIMIAACWIYICLAALVIFPVYDKENDFYQDTACSLLNNIPSWFFFGLLIPHIVIINMISKTLYIRILYVAWKAKSKILEEEAMFQTRKINRKEAKAAKMMTQILTLFMVSWAPYTILHIALYIIGPTAASWLFTALEVSKLLSLSNSYMNPIIYFWKNPDFRLALWACAHCQSQTKVNRVSILSVGEPITSVSETQA